MLTKQVYTSWLPIAPFVSAQRAGRLLARRGEANLGLCVSESRADVDENSKLVSAKLNRKIRFRRLFVGLSKKGRPIHQSSHQFLLERLSGGGYCSSGYTNRRRQRASSGSLRSKPSSNPGEAALALSLARARFLVDRWPQ